jgi:hypothetical protein
VVSGSSLRVVRPNGAVGVAARTAYRAPGASNLPWNAKRAALSTRRPFRGLLLLPAPDRSARPGTGYQKSPMPPGGIAGAADFGSGLSVTMASVVSTMAAIEAAFSTAERVTFAGSTIPNDSMSPYWPVITS